jgi:hypothetical protein
MSARASRPDPAADARIDDESSVATRKPRKPDTAVEEAAPSSPPSTARAVAVPTLATGRMIEGHSAIARRSPWDR